MTTATRSTTSEAPKFTRGARMMREPLPPSLARAVPAAKRRQHEQIAERLAASSRKLAELRRQIAEAPRTDAEAAAAAVAAGEEVPGSVEPRLKEEYSETQRVHHAIEDGLSRSANELLAEAVGHAEKVAGRLEEEQRAAVEDVRGDLAALHERLAVLTGLSAELGWTKALGYHATISPFQPGQTFRETQGHVSTVAEAFDHELTRFEDGLREARAWAEHNAELTANAAAERERRGAARS